MFMFSHHFVWVLINVERDRMGVCLRDLKRVRTGIKPRQMRATLRNGPRQSTDWKVMESRKVNVCVCVSVSCLSIIDGLCTPAIPRGERL